MSKIEYVFHLYISSLLQGATNLSFCPSTNPKAPRLLLTETFGGPIVSTVKLGNKELFGHPKIVPECQKFLITNIEPKYHIRYT